MTANVSARHFHGAHAHTHPYVGEHCHLRHPTRSTAAAVARGALANPVYRRLLAAQLISLAGTGVTTVALGLLAYDLGGPSAGAILGAALTLKMVAYVALSPLIAAYAHRVDRRRLLIGLDLTRAVMLAVLPFVTRPWQVLALVFIVSACAAGFTPAFQAALPDVLPDEDDYTRALSFSRAAYDLADLLSPLAAGALLLVIDFHALFAIDAASFLVSAALLASITLPSIEAACAVSDRVWARITAGARAFAHRPELRALQALNVVAAAASAMVIVNTVVIVRTTLHLDPAHVAIAFAVAGTGSIATTLAIPALLRHVSDRTTMLAGAALLTATLAATAWIATYPHLLAVWLLTGSGLALVQTPIGRLLQRNADPDGRPALFAAQFALSHACWLATYPIAGIVGATVGTTTIALLLAALTAIAATSAAMLWHAPAVAPT